MLRYDLADQLDLDIIVVTISLRTVSGRTESFQAQLMAEREAELHSLFKFVKHFIRTRMFVESVA